MFLKKACLLRAANLTRWTTYLAQHSGAYRGPTADVLLHVKLKKRKIVFSFPFSFNCVFVGQPHEIKKNNEWWRECVGAVARPANGAGADVDHHDNSQEVAR